MDHPDMSFFPEGFDPRAEVIGVLDLIKIDTPDGVYGFMPGVDGKFTDIDGQEYWGGILITDGALQMAIQGTAPEGEIGMAFFSDPDGAQLIADIRELGLDYVQGRAITFLIQPLTDMAQFYAPVLSPIQIAQRRMTRISYAMTGPIQRQLSVGYEGVFAGRNAGPGLFYTTEDHAKLLGTANPSLTYMPRDDFTEKQMY
jgi:hypothetical protein